MNSLENVGTGVPPVQRDAESVALLSELETTALVPNSLETAGLTASIAAI